MYDQGQRPPDQAVVVGSRLGPVFLILGFLALVFFGALAASETAQETTGGRIAAAVFFGVLGLLPVLGFYLAYRNRPA